MKGNLNREKSCSLCYNRLMDCSCFPESERKKMRHLAHLSVQDKVEYGAVIEPGCALGPTIQGKAHEISIEKTPTSIGSSHTHPYAEAIPSAADIEDMLVKQDKLMCIIQAAHRNPDINCYNPQSPEKFQAMGLVARWLKDDVKSYVQDLVARHGPEMKAETTEEKLRGMELRKRALGVRLTIEKTQDSLLRRCSLKGD